eukprot:1155646-Pelagomonas_calceolata.AAC.2
MYVLAESLSLSSVARTKISSKVLSNNTTADKLVYVCPRADQFRSAAAVVACAESSLLAVTASRGNSEFALDSLKLCS